MCRGYRHDAVDAIRMECAEHDCDTAAARQADCDRCRGPRRVEYRDRVVDLRSITVTITVEHPVGLAIADGIVRDHAVVP